jgi:hypothetical protein
VLKGLADPEGAVAVADQTVGLPAGLMHDNEFPGIGVDAGDGAPLAGHFDEQQVAVV